LAPEGIRIIWRPDGFACIKTPIMNRRNILGTILTLLGSGGLLYAAIWFVNSLEGANNTKALVILGVISLAFFIVGINLVNTTKHSA